MHKILGSSILGVLLALPNLVFAAGGGGEDTLLWKVGMMPMQMLIYLTIIMFLFIFANAFLKKIGKGVPAFAQFFAIWFGAYAFFKWILYPPIPGTLLYTYMGLVTLVVFLYISATEQSWNDFKRPILNTLYAVNPMYKQIRNVSFVAFPLFLGFGLHNQMVPKFDEPVELRTVHPAPPAATKVRGKKFQLQTARNPFRVDEAGEYLDVGAEQEYFGANSWDEDVVPYLRYVREGGEIFFQNCHFCHGDNLDGKGMFAFAFNPIPANFVDPGTIAQLQDTYVFWRIGKGGPGLPNQSFPWASAMPPWEEHLTTDEIWKVNMFEYWHTGFFPRTWD